METSVFKMNPDGSVSLTYRKPIKLTAQTSIPLRDTQDIYPSALDQLIKQSLAEQLVNQIIEEDLIDIHANEDLTNNTINFRADLAILQDGV